MNRFEWMAAVALAVGSTGALAQTDWKAFPALEASGMERLFGGKSMKLTVRKSGGQLGFVTQRGLDGSLLGVDRSEVSNSSGIFTWLTKGSKWAIQLTGPSVTEYSTLLQPVRFRKSVVTEGRRSMEKSIGRPVSEIQNTETTGRPSYLLTVGDSTAPNYHQKLYIDVETGITLRRQDTTGDSEDYSMEFSKFSTAATANLFQLPADFHSMRGLVHPEIMLHADEGRTFIDYLTGIQNLKKSVRLGRGEWVKSLPELDGFRFVHSAVTDQKSQSSASPKSGGALSGPEFLPGGLPPGWSVSADVDPMAGTIMFNFQRPEGGGPRAMVNAPGLGGGSSKFGMTITEQGKEAEALNFSYVAYIAPDGRMVIASGDSVEEAELDRKAMHEEAAGRWIGIQSDFLDDKTGNTVSFIQLRNRSFALWSRKYRLTVAPSVKSEKLGEVLVREISKPYRVNLITWKSTEGEYVLTSSRLSVEELVRVGERIGK